MSARDGNLSGFAFQRETLLGAASAEIIYKIRDVVTLVYDPVLITPDARVGISRMKEKETAPTLYWKGTLDIEHGNCAFVPFFLSLFFASISSTNNAPLQGLATDVFRPARMKPVSSAKLFLDLQGGPYKTLHGVVIDRISFGVRLKQIVRTQIYFKALAIEERMSPQASTAIDSTVVTARQSSLVIGGVAQRGITEFTINFAQDKSAAAFGQDKRPRKFATTGHYDCSGDFQQYLDTGNLIESLVQSRAETSLSLTLDAGNSQMVLISLPRIVFTGRTQPINKGDIFVRAPWTALADPDINESSEPTITAVTPSLTKYLLTEEGDNRITEDGNRLTTES